MVGKTVEYSFVCLAIEKDIFNLLLPLDGDVESIGDGFWARIQNSLLLSSSDHCQIYLESMRNIQRKSGY